MSKTIKVKPSYVPERHKNILSTDIVYTAIQSDFDENVYDILHPTEDKILLSCIRLDGCAYLDDHPWFIIVEDKPEISMKRKHYDLIIAWANGAEIECSYDRNSWEYINNPTWAKHINYRIKTKFININGFEVPEPLYERPKEPTNVYLVALRPGKYIKVLSSTVADSIFSEGLIQRTAEGCQKHIDALLSFTKRD